MKVVPLRETDRSLARQRLVLEKLLIHFEGLLPGTDASKEVALRIAHELLAIRGLEDSVVDAYDTLPKSVR